MKHLLRTTAIALAASGIAFGASAQQNGQNNQLTGSANAGVGAQASYCDKPWAQVDGNSDGFVSKDEASAAVDSQFGHIDADSNGEITKTEWVDCLSRMRGQTAAETDRNEQNFAEADTNQDGQIRRDEFREGARQAFENARPGDASENAVVVLRRYIFLTPNESQDQSALGKMSADEAAGRSALTFSALDQNGDEIIDTQEWSQRSPRVARDQEWANAQFDEIDKDATGSISKEEYQTSRQQMLEDELTTGSTNNTGANITEDTGAASADGTATGPDQAQRVPIFIYQFRAM